MNAPPYPHTRATLVPTPMRQRTIRADDPLWDTALYTARTRGDDVSRVVRDALAKYVAQHVVPRLVLVRLMADGERLAGVDPASLHTVNLDPVVPGSDWWGVQPYVYDEGAQAFTKRRGRAVVVVSDREEQAIRSATPGPDVEPITVVGPWATDDTPG